MVKSGVVVLLMVLVLVSCASPTATPTPTLVQTPMVSPTPTLASTSTPTPSATPILTPTPTAVPTPIVAPTSTPTSTVSPTPGLTTTPTRGASVVSGRVTDAAGSGLAGATITVWKHEQQVPLAEAPVTKVTADSSGHYTVVDLQPGQYRIRAVAIGYTREFYLEELAWDQADPVPVAAGKETADISFTLEAGGSISGMVTDSASGEPLRGVSVYASGLDGTSISALTTSGENGEYEIDGLAFGIYQVQAPAPLRLGPGDDDYATQYWRNANVLGNATAVVVSPQESPTAIDFQLAAGTTLSATPSPTLVPTYSVAWEQEVQITATGAPSFFPTMAVSGSTVHLAWVDQRDGGENREIYYQRSVDGGTHWQMPVMRISNDPSYSIRADFAIQDDIVHLFWRDDRDGNYEEYLRQSMDGGVSWGPEVRITNSPGLSGCPFPAVDGETVHLFFRDDRSGTFKIYYKRSVDGGAHWDSDTVLTPDGTQAEFPFPAIDGETIHLVWRDNRDGNPEIYYKRSLDGGITWSQDERLTSDPGESEHPKLVMDGNNLHLVWRENRDGSYEVYYKRSIDGGRSWSSDRRMTDNAGKSLWPVLAVGGDLVHLVWSDDSDGNQGLYYMFSSDGGSAWSSANWLSDNTTLQDLMGAHPMVVSGSTIHVGFSDDRTGIDEIYYKRGSILHK